MFESCRDRQSSGWKKPNKDGHFLNVRSVPAPIAMSRSRFRMLSTGLRGVTSAPCNTDATQRPPSCSFLIPPRWSANNAIERQPRAPTALISERATDRSGFFVRSFVADTKSSSKRTLGPYPPIPRISWSGSCASRSQCVVVRLSPHRRAEMVRAASRRRTLHSQAAFFRYLVMNRYNVSSHLRRELAEGGADRRTFLHQRANRRLH